MKPSTALVLGVKCLSRQSWSYEESWLWLSRPAFAIPTPGVSVQPYYQSTWADIASCGLALNLATRHWRQSGLARKRTFKLHCTARFMRFGCNHRYKRLAPNMTLILLTFADCGFLLCIWTMLSRWGYLVNSKSWLSWPMMSQHRRSHCRKLINLQVWKIVYNREQRQ
jgi:hypothetical protein